MRAVEREKVRTCWNIGKLILEYVLLNRKKGAYGQSVIVRLAKDLSISERELQYMVEFARTYSNLPPAADLSWSAYRELLAVNEPEKRKQLAREAVAGDWTRQKLRTEIKKVKTGSPIRAFGDDSVGSFGNDGDLKPGKPGVRRFEKWNGRFYYDLGFSTYFEINKKPTRKNPAAQDLYYYEVRVDHVVDGDTIWANVDLGFGVWSYQKLRLRSIDAPELNTRAGQESKRFLEKALKKAGTVIIRTLKSDKYDRYLADVWADKIWLNGALVASDLADSVQ